MRIVYLHIFSYKMYVHIFCPSYLIVLSFNGMAVTSPLLSIGIQWVVLWGILRDLQWGPLYLTLSWPIDPLSADFLQLFPCSVAKACHWECFVSMGSPFQ